LTICVPLGTAAVALTRPAAAAALTLSAAKTTLALASARPSAPAALGSALRHALLEGGSLFRRHRGHPLFHPLAPLFRRHVRIEPASAAAVETSTAAALRSALTTAVRCTVGRHPIAAALSLGRRATIALTLTTLSLTGRR